LAAYASCTTTEVQIPTGAAVRPPISIDSFLIEKRLDDSTAIGFQKIEFSPALGLAGMAIVGDTLYISDSFYGNVKAISLRSGQVILVSQRFENKYNDLGAVYPSGTGVICLTTFQDKVFFIDSNLVTIEPRTFKKGLKQFVIQDGLVAIEASVNRGWIYDLELIPHRIRSAATPIYAYRQELIGEERILVNYFGSFIVTDTITESRSLEPSAVCYNQNRIVVVKDLDPHHYKFLVYTY
jgi:hypothetical protein